MAFSLPSTTRSRYRPSLGPLTGHHTMDTGDDCRFFINSVCAKGDACTYRHVAEAKLSELTCENWRLGRCMVSQCPYRHSEIPREVTCYYEMKPGGCTRPDCVYLHKFPRATAPPLSTTDLGALPISVAPPSQATVIIQPQPPVSTPMQGGWNAPQSHTGPPPQRQAGPPPQHTGPPQRYTGPPPQHIRPPHPGMWQPGRPAVPGFYPRPGVPIPQHMRPGLPPTSAPYPGIREQHFYPPHHPAQISQVQPIIINPNEESDIENSPVKQANRTVQQPPRVDNPLDYFLNAKPFIPIDPNPPQPRPLQGSPSPSPPSQRHGSLSPIRRSPRRSLSPDNARRRSTSAERYSDNRRRSNSVDRSRSPDRGRDTRRFGRRSPQRRRSRSPLGGRGRNSRVLNRPRASNSNRGQPRFSEVKVSGPKIVSLKKDKKEEEDEQKEKTEDEKTEKPEKPKEKAEIDSVEVVKEEVKSLEEIYRERALLSMMEAKRKKILESKRKRWEGVKGNEARKSESEKSDKSDDSQPNPVTEKGDNSTHEKEDNSTHDESSSESGEGEAGSELDFGEDVDIELGEGEIEEEERQEEPEEESEEEKHEDERKPVLKKREIKRERGKRSIKSRLGLRALEDVTKQSTTTTNKKGSIKDRLGIKITESDSDKPLRSGVIKLNRGSKSDDIFSRIQKNRESRNRENSKNVLLLPQITIKNNAEDRKMDIKQRLGLLDSKDVKKRKKKDIDNELIKLLSEEDVDIDFDDLELLSKKEKKKLLKKLLVQQGRENEYYEITSKKKKKHGRRKEYSDEEGEHGRRVKVKDRKERIEEESEGEEELQSEEEIEFADDAVDSKENTEEQEVEEDEVDVEGDDKDSPDEAVPSPVPAKTEDELQQEKAEKEAKLREALEPKSLADIRRERAIKRATGESTVVSTGQNRRKIIVADEEPLVENESDPPVKVTFGGIRENKRKLVRIGRNTPEPADNIQITTGRTARKERQIYIPPTAKKTESESSVISKKRSDISRGRDIVDYSDMFVKKSTSMPNVTDKKSVKITARLTPNTGSQTLKISRGPPKVEVKDATVKTFAEIMAEKKRKRLEAQQAANKKPFNPLSLDDPESSSSPKSLPTDSSPILSSSQPAGVTSSPVKSQLKTLNLKKSASQTNVTQDNKPKRWKRQNLSAKKTNEQNTTNTIDNKPNTVNVDSKAAVTSLDTFSTSAVTSKPTVPTIVESSKSSNSSVHISTAQSKLESPPKQKQSIIEPEPVVAEVKVSPQDSASKRRISDEQPTAVGGSSEKKAKFSDSLLLDFEDDLLDLDDDELELNDDQDHDQLMKELEELL